MGNGTKSYKKDKLNIRICITGIGGVATAYSVSKSLWEGPCDLAVQAGIGGAFSDDTPIGSVWRIKSDAFADLGAENQDTFIDLFELGFQQPDGFPFSGKKLPAQVLDIPVLATLPEADAITVNTAGGNIHTINKRKEKYHARIESMEGAAFHYVCLAEKVNFAQIRSVSNHVTVRDKSQWNIPLAVKRLNEVLVRLTEEL